MDAGRILIAPPTPPTLHSRPLPFSISVSMPHDQASCVPSTVPPTSLLRMSLSPALFQQQCDACISSCCTGYEKIPQAAMGICHLDGRLSICEEEDHYGPGQYQKYSEGPLFSHSCKGGGSVVVPFNEALVSNNYGVDDIKVPHDLLKSVRADVALSLASKAMIVSTAASLAKETNTLAVNLNDSNVLSLNSEESSNSQEEVTVRSRRFMKRRLKRRKVLGKVCKTNQDARLITSSIRKKFDREFESNDPLKLFFWGPETKQLLTVKEEKTLIAKVQDLMRVEEVKQRLHVELNRDPTLTEWAQAVRMDCQTLLSKVHCGKQSRNKLIYSNFRLVVHIAKQYEGRGLNLQDLLQEGSMGLMRSLEKFKPKAGCRFPSYAYWWIRQSIRKAIFQNSRTIRLPENVFALIKRIKRARRLYNQEGRRPTKEELARSVGITVQKLEKLLSSSRNPISIQEHAWIDQDVTVQEITADPEVEIPDRIIAERLMRQHIHSLLRILTPREIEIIQFRFGLSGHDRKSLSDIGDMYSLSKERVRQIEIRALDKLRNCLQEQGLGAYAALLI